MEKERFIAEYCKIIENKYFKDGFYTPYFIEEMNIAGWIINSIYDNVLRKDNYILHFDRWFHTIKFNNEDYHFPCLHLINNLDDSYCDFTTVDENTVKYLKSL